MDLDILSQRAYRLWLSSHEFGAADRLVAPILEIETAEINRVKGCWLRTARRALSLSAREVASRLQMSHQNYLRIECDEESGKVPIAMMERVADAMDCELILAIRPKARLPFSRVVWNQIDLPARSAFLKRFPPGTQAYRRMDKWAEFPLLSIARELSTNAKFRKSLGWSRLYKRPTSPSRSCKLNLS